MLWIGCYSNVSPTNQSRLHASVESGEQDSPPHWREIRISRRLYVQGASHAHALLY